MRRAWCETIIWRKPCRMPRSVNSRGCLSTSAPSAGAPSSRSAGSTRRARPVRPAGTGSTPCRCRCGYGTALRAVRTTTATSTRQGIYWRRGSASSPTRKVPRGTREPWRLYPPKRSGRGRKTLEDRIGPRRQTSKNRESPGFNYGECQNRFGKL